MRAMGIKRPLILDMEPGEEKTMKAMTSSDAKLAATCEQMTAGSDPGQAAQTSEYKRRAQERARRARMNPDGSPKKRYADGSGTGI
jgi:hypothetical protein